MYNVGIDIGGTFIKGGIICGGKILTKAKIPTPKENDEKKIMADISNLIADLLAKIEGKAEDIENIGIGLAGNHDKGVCLFMPNTSWKNIHIAKKLNKRFNCPVTIVNDLKAATLGELYYGAGKKCKDFVFVGLGTGLNCGVVKEKYIIEGIEFGHVIVDRGGKPCGCGKKGCLESLVSKKNILDLASKYYGNIDSVRLLFEKAKVDVEAKSVIREYIAFLNIGLMNICNSFRPEKIILGGGISAGLKDYIKEINTLLAKNSYGYPTAKKTVVEISKVGNDCGILGASTLK